MKEVKKCEFSSLRKIFFPIYAYELKKIIPLSLILFIALFNHYCLKNIKDSLIVTTVGAEAISFIKLFCIPPATIICMLLYTKISDKIKNQHLFYLTLSCFIVFFALFAFVLYPYRDVIHPSQSVIKHMQEISPSLHIMFAVFGVWSYALFYIFAELWSSFILMLSFWQFVNQITEFAEAKRIYAFLALFGQSAVTFAGIVGIFASDIKSKVSDSTDPWQVSLDWLICIIIVGSIAIMYIYHWIYKNVLTDKRFYNKPTLPGINVEKKKKSSLIQSLKVALTSKYIGLIAILVISYGIADNILENFWKYEVSQKYQDINMYNTFMCRYTTSYGIMSIFVLIIAGYVFRNFRWRVGAVITPIIITIGGIIVFGGMFSKNFIFNTLGSYAAYHSVIICAGLIALVAIKSCKMSFFDLSKEMAYIPLDEEMKVKGKAVVDVIGYRFGKSGGSGLQVVLLLLMTLITGQPATYSTIAPYAFSIFIVSCITWTIAVVLLSNKIKDQ